MSLTLWDVAVMSEKDAFFALSKTLKLKFFKTLSIPQKFNLINDDVVLNHRKLNCPHASSQTFKSHQ